MSSSPRTRVVARLAVPLLAGLLLLLSASCGGDAPPGQFTNVGGPVADPEEPIRTVQLPLDEAPCTIHVEGHGDVEIEEDYIPNVVACENGNAPMEALKAQAILARGYIYYKLFVAGEDSVVDSQADQVYSCDYADAEDRHLHAARATRAEYLTWQGQIIAPFYVAGAIPADPDDGPAEDACMGTGGDDATDTEHFVTYNLGKSGCDIEMTTLGWPPDDCNDNPHNRGCSSQNGQSCLADRGWDYTDMLPYYYGEDIEVQLAEGECGGSWSDHDLHCAGTGDGWSCMGTERVNCQGDAAEDIEDCAHGCASGECNDPPAEGFCAEEAPGDGWHCIDDGTRGHCEGDEMTTSEDCPGGCEAGECLEDESDNGDGDNGGGDNGDGDNGDGDDDDDNGDDDNDEAPDTDTEPASLVTPSPGVEGGCSQTGGAAPPWALMMVLVGLAALTSFRTTGRRRRRARG